MLSLQPGQVPGAMAYMPPTSNYGGSLAIPSMGPQQGLPLGANPGGSYTALLGPQMQVQNLLPPGVMPGQYHPSFGHIPTASEAEAQQAPASQPKKRQSEGLPPDTPIPP